MKAVRIVLWVLAMAALLVTSYAAAGSVIMPGPWHGVILFYRVFYIAAFVVSIACLCGAALARTTRRKVVLLAVTVSAALVDLAFVWEINR